MTPEEEKELLKNLLSKPIKYLKEEDEKLYQEVASGKIKGREFFKKKNEILDKFGELCLRAKEDFCKAKEK